MWLVWFCAGLGIGFLAALALAYPILHALPLGRPL